MALPLPPNLTPKEIAFLCEMELVTVIPRQRLESLQLLGGSTQALRPPHRANVPLWLALLLKRQRRASIVPPPWLQPVALERIFDRETSSQFLGNLTPSTPLPDTVPSDSGTDFAKICPPFQEDATASAPDAYLPYHFLEIGNLLLAAASEDIPEAQAVRQWLRDLQEVRTAKVRSVVGTLEAGAGLDVTGIGAMEVSENRLFLQGVVDGLRKVGASREVAERERVEEMGGIERHNDDDDDNMLL